MKIIAEKKRKEEEEKLMRAKNDLEEKLKQEKLEKNDPILIIHCGGLQGNKGYEERYNLNPSRQVNDAQG